jgi:CBS domain-containing protein
VEVTGRVSSILAEKGGEVFSIGPSATVYAALELMAAKGVGALLVMENNRIIGVLSERDYARKIILKGRSSKDTKVSEIMISPALTISPDCSASEAMQMMTDHRIRHLPVVVGSGAVVGIVSIGDLVKWIITSQQETIDQLHSYITGSGV